MGDFKEFLMIIGVMIFTIVLLSVPLIMSYAFLWILFTFWQPVLAISVFVLVAVYVLKD